VRVDWKYFDLENINDIDFISSSTSTIGELKKLRTVDGDVINDFLN